MFMLNRRRVSREPRRRGGAWLAVLALGVASQACSANIQGQKVMDVERVAIIEYQATVEAPTNKTPWAAIKGAVENSAEQAGNEAYALFAQGLNQEFSMDVMTREALIAHPAYREVFDKYQGKGLAGFAAAMDSNNIDYRPGGIIKGYSRSQLKDEERLALMTALGVDALVTCYMQIKEAGSVGIGPYKATKYRATAQFHMFDKSGEIWSEPGATGDSGESVHRLSLPVGQQEMGEEDAEKKSFLQALASAQERMFQRFYEVTGLSRGAPSSPAAPPEEATGEATEEAPGYEEPSDGEAPAEGGEEPAGEDSGGVELAVRLAWHVPR